MLSSDERRRLSDALSKWAKDAPGDPIIGFLGQDRLLTPTELARAVVAETPDGLALLEILEHGVRREGLSTVVKRLTYHDQDGLAENSPVTPPPLHPLTH